MKKAIRFSIVVCMVSWLLALMFYLLAKPTAEGAIPMLVFSTFYMFVPLICAMVVQVFDKEKFSSTGLLKFKPNSTWFKAWLLVPIIVAASIPVNALFSELCVNVPEAPGINSDAAFFAITLVSGLFAGVTLNAVAAFGEEYAWRNYMLAALSKTSFIKACIVIGLVWGIWHFPLILMGHNYPEHRVEGVFVFCVTTLLLGFIETYFVVKARSVYPAAIFHGTFNALAGVVTLFVAKPNDLLTGLPGLAGIITLSVVCVLIYIYDQFISKDRLITSTIEDALYAGKQ